MVQGKLNFSGSARVLQGVVVIAVALCAGELVAQVATTSPLSILQQAPRVRLDETPDSAAPPPVQASPAYPYSVPLQRPPRPVVEETTEAEEDDEGREKKPGVVRGIIRAIPFIGKKIAGPGETPVSETEEPEEDEVETSSDRPATIPTPLPGSGRDIPSYVFPTAPRPTVAAPALDPDVTPGTTLSTPAIVGSEEAPMLSVKPARPIGETTTLSVTVSPPAQTPALRKEPAVAVETPSALNLDETPSPTPVTEATPTPTVESTPTPTPVVVAEVTSPTLQPTDLGMPNPAYEQNDTIRAEYSDAVKAGRDGKYAEAAQQFRDYAENHPSSGLAPRALFLAAVLSTDPTKAAEAHNLLKERFATSRYLKELEKRTEGKLPAKATPTPDPNESPAQAAMRLENELTQAVGNPATEVPLRLRLGQAYMTSEEYERAYEVLRPAREMSAGRPEEAEILVLISECLIATSKTEQAAALLSDMLQRFPTAPLRPRAQYDLGLVSEASGNYARARAIYNEISQQWPDTAEGQQAQQRLKDLAGMAE